MKKRGKFARKHRSPMVPILRSVAIITLCAILIYGVIQLMENRNKLGTEDSVTTVPNADKDAFNLEVPTLPSQAEATVDFQHSEAINLLREVAKGEHSLILKELYTDRYSDVNLYKIKDLGEDFIFDTAMLPTQFSMVDLDRDGVPEVVVELDSDMGGWRLVLRYCDGQVYGYPYSFRGLQTVSVDGFVGGSNSAFDSPVSRLSFDGINVDSYGLSAEDASAVRDSWQEVTWYIFSDSNINAVIIDSQDFSGEEASSYSEKEAPSTLEEVPSKYPLDFIGKTTGDVISNWGSNYILSHGYEGAKLFYYGDKPDIEFGFVPYDWNDPQITGSESIAVIILRGNAKINSYLSADLSKSQIDAVAWNTPNVQNVSADCYYSEMSGSTFQYIIETSNARIIYLWSLDAGDEIEYAASEVTVSPK